LTKDVDRGVLSDKAMIATPNVDVLGTTTARTSGGAIA
jgi:hypothetical protein